MPSNQHVLYVSNFLWLMVWLTFDPSLTTEEGIRHYHLPMTARAVALVKSLFMLSMTSKPLPSRLHLLKVPLAELIQYIFPAGKSIESPEGKQKSVKNCYLEC